MAWQSIDYSIDVNQGLMDLPPLSCFISILFILWNCQVTSLSFRFLESRAVVGDQMPEPPGSSWMGGAAALFRSSLRMSKFLM